MFLTSPNCSYFTNSEKFWNFLNSVKGCCNSIPLLKNKDNLVTVDISMKATFNSVFTTEQYTDRGGGSSFTFGRQNEISQA